MKLYAGMVTVIYDEEITDEDVSFIIEEFKKWIQSEYDKRRHKKGEKLFQFSYCNGEYASLLFSNVNHTKGIHLLEGCCGDVFKQKKIHKAYLRVAEEAVKIADEFVKENGLAKTIEESAGTALIYNISKK